MPKVKNIKGYYQDKINNCYVVQIKDIHFTKNIIKKSFSYKDDYKHTKQEAEDYAKKISNYLLTKRAEKIKPLKKYVNDIEVIDNSWL